MYSKHTDILAMAREKYAYNTQEHAEINILLCRSRLIIETVVEVNSVFKKINRTDRARKD